MAGKHRDQALKELQEMSDGLEKDLGTVTKRVQEELNSLQQLQTRAQRALSSSACNTEVLQVERLQVIDYDRFSRDDPIGETYIPLNETDLSQSPVVWKFLQPCKDTRVTRI